MTIVLIEQFIHRALALAERVRDPAPGSGGVDRARPTNARQEVLDRYLGESADAMS